MTDPTPMSPAAEAIADAFEEAWRLTPEADPYECCVQPVGAALRAAADQVVPEGFADAYDCCLEIVAEIRDDILAIAAELEGAQ